MPAPEDPVGYEYLAPLLLQLDKVEAYQHCRNEMLRRFGNTSEPRTAAHLAKACLILPPNADELAVTAKLANVAVPTGTDSDSRAFGLFARGFAEYRQSHFARAADNLKQVLPLDPGSACEAETYLVLAMAQFQLNESNESKASLAKAVDLVDHSLRRPGDLKEDWDDWIIVHVLLREALALIPDVQSQAAALARGHACP